MRNDLENSDWMNEAPYLAGLRKEHPFTVPEGYFEGLPEHIHQAIFMDNLENSIPDAGFQVPTGYFDELTEDIQSKVSTLRLKTVVPDEGYAVPNDYFTQLQAKINAKTTEESNKKSEPKILRLWHSKLLKYASAACFIIVSATAFYFYPQVETKHHVSPDFANEQMLFDIDEHTIIEHIESNDLERHAPAPTVAEADLENYILSNYSQNDIAADF